MPYDLKLIIVSGFNASKLNNFLNDQIFEIKICLNNIEILNFNSISNITIW